MTKYRSFRILSACAAALALCCAAHPAAAEPAEASAAKASFAEGRDSGVTPQTPGEYLRCAAIWDRWAYFMASSKDAEFNRGVGKELSAKAARKHAAQLRKTALALAREWEDEDELPELTAQGEADADEQYAAFVKSEPRGAHSLLMSLGICR